MILGKKFWLVWLDGRGSVPQVKHESFAGAQQEAYRLAKKHPGSTFVVLAAEEGWACPISCPEQVCYGENNNTVEGGGYVVKDSKHDR